MKRILFICILFVAAVLAANAQEKNHKYPTPQEKAKQEAKRKADWEKQTNAWKKKLDKMAEVSRDRSLRKVPITISGRGMEPIESYGVLLDVNISKTKGKVLLDRKISKHIAYLGEDNLRNTPSDLCIRVDLGTYGKGIVAKNAKAGNALRPYQVKANDVLYIYDMPVNPKGEFAQKILTFHPMSVLDGRKMLGDKK